MINAPVLHVNGDHPEGRPSCPDSSLSNVTANSCRKMSRELSKRPSNTETTSARYLWAICVIGTVVDIFQKDVVVDLIVYRRW